VCYPIDTALTCAARNGHPELCKLLVQRGADPAARRADGLTALHVAAQHGRAEACEALLDLGANVNALAEHAESALVLATQIGHQRVCELLIRRGARLNTALDAPLFPPLCVAPNVESARMLLEAGADANARVPSGATPLHYAAQVRPLVTTLHALVFLVLT
jgi:ankyrin repeat protein